MRSSRAALEQRIVHLRRETANLSGRSRPAVQSEGFVVPIGRRYVPLFARRNQLKLTTPEVFGSGSAQVMTLVQVLYGKSSSDPPPLSPPSPSTEHHPCLICNWLASPRAILSGTYEL